MHPKQNLVFSVALIYLEKAHRPRLNSMFLFLNIESLHSVIDLLVLLKSIPKKIVTHATLQSSLRKGGGCSSKLTFDDGHIMQRLQLDTRFGPTRQKTLQA